MGSLLDDAPVYIGKDFVKNRYGCGDTKAYEIIRCVKKTFNGGRLPYRGRILLDELLDYEKIREIKWKERL